MIIKHVSRFDLFFLKCTSHHAQLAPRYENKESDIKIKLVSAFAIILGQPWKGAIKNH